LNGRDNGVIWVKAHPFLLADSHRELEVMLNDYADGLSGAGLYAQSNLFSIERVRETALHDGGAPSKTWRRRTTICDGLSRCRRLTVESQPSRETRVVLTSFFQDRNTLEKFIGHLTQYGGAV
jgi:hypothetical protein